MPFASITSSSSYRPLALTWPKRGNVLQAILTPTAIGCRTAVGRAATEVPEARLTSSEAVVGCHPRIRIQRPDLDHPKLLHGYLPACPNTTDGYHVNNLRWVYLTPQQQQQLRTGTSPGATRE